MLHSSAFLLLPRHFKQVLAVTLDLTLATLGVWLSFYLRLGYFKNLLDIPLLILLISPLLSILVFTFCGVYQTIFRYSGYSGISPIVKASTIYGVLFFGIFSLYGIDGVPRTIGIIQPLLFFIMVCASRVMVEIILSPTQGKIQYPQKAYRVLIYGAGKSGRQLAVALRSVNEVDVVGFLDDNINLHNQYICGLPVYCLKNLEKISIEKSVTDVWLAMPSISRSKRNTILAGLSGNHLRVRTIPTIGQFILGPIDFNAVSDLDADDLLGRSPLFDEDFSSKEILAGKTILVTGAGGSIGSELCRQILANHPKRLLLLELSEAALYEINAELKRIIEINHDKGLALIGENLLSNREVEVIPLLGSVCDSERIRQILEAWKPEIIYHAAAYKHVPLAEHNPVQTLNNNVWGTLICARAAIEFGVENFVLVSTDKAVRPTNIMGASKRLAEMIVQALSNFHLVSELNSKATKLSMVRFGNVLDSSGSVVPLFRKQIRAGGPVTITHLDITRYFMTITEAAQLVIHAGSLSAGGEVFLLDMGEPVRIYDLAIRMIKLSGMVPKESKDTAGDIEIQITGLRPGEKLYEELLIGDNPMSTNHPRIFKAHEDFLELPELEDQLESLLKAMNLNDIYLVRKILKKLIGDYNYNPDIVDWVFQENKSQL